MTGDFEDKFDESLRLMNNLFSSEREVKNIEEILGSYLNNNSLTGAIEALELMYGVEVSDVIIRVLSAPIICIEKINNGNYSRERDLILFILKFKSELLRVRQIEETGYNTVIRIAELISGNIINYTMQTADNTYFEFKVSHENQIGIINYFTKVLSNHVENSQILDENDLAEFSGDLTVLKETLAVLESNIKKRLEDLEDGEE